MEDEKYMLIKADEDGEPVSFLSKKELQELLKDPAGEYGVKKFLTTIPEKSTSYWKEGEALLLEFKILKPHPSAFSIAE